jgi:thiol-disulfide isomerase/thioredoxin
MGSVSLSSFKGKYFLLDFWASWCGPCRRENPNVVKAYRQYHNKGFDILGVSLDDSKDDWLKAIKKDGLSWTQVSDLKGWKNEAATLYGIQGIPMNFLIDKEGKIIAKNLRGQDLEKRLAEVLNK